MDPNTCDTYDSYKISTTTISRFFFSPLTSKSNIHFSQFETAALVYTNNGVIVQKSDM